MSAIRADHRVPGLLVAVRPRAPGLPHSFNAYASMGTGQRDAGSASPKSQPSSPVSRSMLSLQRGPMPSLRQRRQRQSRRQKESRPRAAPCLLSEGSSVVIGVSDRVLHVAGDIMRGALRLVDFAFRLQLLIAGYLAG
jgi:hypothetical protein